MEAVCQTSKMNSNKVNRSINKYRSHKPMMIPFRVRERTLTEALRNFRESLVTSKAKSTSQFASVKDGQTYRTK